MKCQGRGLFLAQSQIRSGISQKGFTQLSLILKEFVKKVCNNYYPKRFSWGDNISKVECLGVQFLQNDEKSMSSNHAKVSIEDSDTDEDPSDSVFMSAEEELNEDKKR